MEMALCRPSVQANWATKYEPSVGQVGLANFGWTTPATVVRRGSISQIEP